MDAFLNNAKLLGNHVKRPPAYINRAARWGGALHKLLAKAIRPIARLVERRVVNPISQFTDATVKPKPQRGEGATSPRKPPTTGSVCKRSIQQFTHSPVEVTPFDVHRIKTQFQPSKHAKLAVRLFRDQCNVNLVDCANGIAEHFLVVLQDQWMLSVDLLRSAVTMDLHGSDFLLSRTVDLHGADLLTLPYVTELFLKNIQTAF